MYANKGVDPLLYKVFEAYLDDILYWGQSEDEYLQHLEMILERLSLKNIIINPKKCSFGLEEIEYIGHVLDQTGLSFSAKKNHKSLILRSQKQKKILSIFSVLLIILEIMSEITRY